MIVFLEGRPTAGSIGDDGVKTFARKCGDVPACQIARRIAHTGMSGKRAAAKLVARHNDFASVGGQNSNGGFIELGERDLRNAAREQGDARAFRPDRGERSTELREEKPVVNWRKQTFALG